ncbi:MAG: hypothetical protein AB8E15_04905 [Bdellovibrionales bacterium]
MYTSKNTQQFLIFISLGVLMLSYQNCSREITFKKNSSFVEQGAGLDPIVVSPPVEDPVIPPIDEIPVDEDKIICGGLGNISGESLECENGFIGDIYLLGFNEAYSVNTVDTYFNFGQKVNSLVLGEEDAEGVNLVLPRIAIPTQSHTFGFKIGDRVLLDPRTNNQEIMTEYFALNLSSILFVPEKTAGTVSDAITEDGYYEFALISDDGAILNSIDLDTGNVETIVDNDGTHPTRMGCSEPIYLEKSRPLPLNLKYYQGPRTEIALTLVYRPVLPNDNGSHRALCGISDINFFGAELTNSQLQTVIENPVVDSKWNSVVNSGWKVISSENLYRARLPILDSQEGVSQ